MPSGCSVVGCRLGDRPKDALYHRFPKEEGIREEWVIFSGKKKVNFKFERICSVHFKETDYERRLKYEILGLPVPRHRRNLKKDAIPSKNKPKVKGVKMTLIVIPKLPQMNQILSTLLKILFEIICLGPDIA
ncbi:uncharacterized protein [Penaeus vannamei]|uniref:uncharacterized protein n=1 Tax=Penaeus vannamei TaxID=6689 RepID=UPI00387F3E8E